jgi:hypothetical protein
MAGMKLKSFPLMGTWLFGGAFLLATLWHSIFRDGWGFLVSGILFFSFIMYVFWAVVVALVERFRKAWHRCLISGIALGLFIPTIRLGGDVRDQIFLFELPTYQKITDLLISQEGIKSADTTVDFPLGYTSGLVNDEHALIERGDDNSITVLYLTRDSSALGHSGYLYSSDDNLDALKAKRPETGFCRLAPHWYLWAH